MATKTTRKRAPSQRPRPTGSTDPKRFAVGDRVKWTSQAAGSSKTKIGTVVEVVQRHRVPKLADTTGTRHHESYVVEVLAGRGAHVKTITYWPVVSKLNLVRRAKTTFGFAAVMPGAHGSPKDPADITLGEAALHHVQNVVTDDQKRVIAEELGLIDPSGPGIDHVFADVVEHVEEAGGDPDVVHASPEAVSAFNACSAADMDLLDESAMSDGTKAMLGIGN